MAEVDGRIDGWWKTLHPDDSTMTRKELRSPSPWLSRVAPRNSRENYALDTAFVLIDGTTIGAGQIWRTAGNEYLERMLIGITTRLLAQAIMMKRKPGRLRSVIVSHRPLLEFLQGKSSELAEQAVLTHIKHWWARSPELKRVAEGTPMPPRLSVPS